MKGLNFAERGLLPTLLVRFGIRMLLGKRLDEMKKLGPQYKYDFINELKSSPIAINTEDANEQHYELPTEFFELALGKNLKYSCTYWPEGVEDLDESEEISLGMACDRAGLKDGMEVLDLGCGWGSLSLWIASNYPACSVTSVSNSDTQREHIRKVAAERGLTNINVITTDMNIFNPADKFDRIMSIEMFEHMRNYQELFKRISSWLKDDGKLFVHVFTHKEHAYPFETRDEDDWMAKYFFTGGIMPSRDLFTHFNDHLTVEQIWDINGKHYQKTLDAWLHRLEEDSANVFQMFRDCYGEGNEMLWYQRWRMFFMACSELFGYDNGEAWGVNHYLISKNK